MVFGWLSGKKTGGGKALQKAEKLADQGRWAEALTYYEDAREEGSEEARRGVRLCRERLVEYNLEEAQAYLRASDRGKAREHTRLALELASGEQDLQAGARDALAALEEPTEQAPPPRAERLFSPACAADCSAAEACSEEEDVQPSELFEFYLEGLSSREREALEHLGEGFREGFVRLQRGDLPQARPLLERALAEAPGEVGPRYALGLLASLEKDLTAAGQHFSLALQVDPAFAPAAHHRADVLREAGSPAEAGELLEGWLGANPGDGEALALLTVCRLEAGDAPGALAASAEAQRALPPEDPRPQLLRARVLLALGRPDEALSSFRSVATRRPDLLDALVPMGELLIAQGGPAAEKAAEVFKRCYRLDPARGWWYLTRVAQAYAVRGWKAEARDVLLTAGRELPQTEEARAEWDAVSRLSAE